MGSGLGQSFFLTVTLSSSQVEWSALSSSHSFEVHSCEQFQRIIYFGGWCRTNIPWGKTHSLQVTLFLVSEEWPRVGNGPGSKMLSTKDWSEDIITTNTEYTIDPQSNIEETTLYYYQTLEVGQHHTMDPIMEGILSCSLASSRGHPPIELSLQTQYFSSCIITLLKPLYIVLPSPKNILEEESSRSRTF